jgi:cysteinyl-tRNA synthetase
MTALKLFNTLGRLQEEFRPLHPPKVGLYTCGPTVYQRAHLGNLRTFIFEDALRRTLEVNGYKVRHVMNITDVGHLTSDADEGEDKVELSAREQRKSAWEIAQFYTEAFLQDLERLNILRPHLTPKATEHIPEQIELIKRLEAKGFTYRTSDGIYFDVSKFPGYGKLSGQRPDERVAGARVKVNPEKRHPADFALWKFTPPGIKRQMEWESPWGVGFPGWHIECSAMSTKYLGQPFDIHCGGVDHIPIHHENEIAQSEAAFGIEMARFWLHGEFMTVDGRRMGKSEGNAYVVDDLIARGFDPLAFRYLCLNTHYRVKLNFTWEALDGAHRALERLREHVRSYRAEGELERGSILQEAKEAFFEAINDDLNLPAALGVLWDLVRSEADPLDKLATLIDFDRVLGLKLAEVRPEVELDLPVQVRRLLEEREELRRQKRFQEADLLRAKIYELGYEIMDTPEGPKVRPRARRAVT